MLREESTTTKLRIVSNGSSKTLSGVSQDDILHEGAKLYLDAFDVVTWLHQFQLLFCTDITKMFWQIKVRQQDWDYQRISWLDGNNHIITYENSPDASPPSASTSAQGQ
uniref:Uncharacterized protein n=1 Tax=Bracon brevicornis TaxID=1563983 RepID=A0A6V7KPU3_9HYME